jgi:hypothetical protein
VIADADAGRDVDDDLRLIGYVLAAEADLEDFFEHVDRDEAHTVLDLGPQLSSVRRLGPPHAGRDAGARDAKRHFLMEPWRPEILRQVHAVTS